MVKSTSRPELNTLDQHSKICLRRISSRRSLVSTGRHSRLCVRNNTRGIRDRLQTLLRSMSKGRRTTDYFTGRLPTELRLQIYEYLLRFERPIRVRPRTQRTSRFKTVGILLASRLVYMEALPVLYELNTILIHRAELCRSGASYRSKLSCKPELVQRLYLDDLHPSHRCIVKMNRRWPALNQPCENCKSSILGLIDTLRDMPRLREVFIDYHRHASAIQALAEGLRDTEDMGNELHLTCHGIGKYKLSGEWLEGMAFSLRNVPLVEIWTRAIALPRPEPFLPYFRANRALWKDLKAIEACFADRRDFRLMVVQVLMLVAEHDSQLVVPASFASVWPPDLPMDLRRLTQFDRPGFLHRLNVQVQAYLDSGMISIHNPVVRRA